MPYCVGRQAEQRNQQRQAKHHHHAEDRRKGDRGSDVVAVGADDGATAAIAELPQIELPQAIRIDICVGRPSRRLMPIAGAERDDDDRRDRPNSATPEAAIAAKLIEAPSSITATSSSCLALKAMPDCQRGAGFQKRAHRHAEQDRDHQRLDIGMLEDAQFRPFEQGRNAGHGDAEENPGNQRDDAACGRGRLGVGRAGCLILRHKSLPEEKDLYAAPPDWEISFRHIRARGKFILSPE